MGPSHQVAQTPSGGDDVAHWRDEKTEAQHGEAAPGSPGFLGSPRPQSSPTRLAGLPSQPLPPSCLFADPGAPFTQHRAPPSLPLLLIYAPTGLGCPPPRSSFLGLSTLCGSSHRQLGVPESSQPLHLEHSEKPTDHISEPHLFCSQTCAWVRWAGLCSTWDPISWNHLPAPMPWSGTKAPASSGARASSQPAGGSQGRGWRAGGRGCSPCSP